MLTTQQNITIKKLQEESIAKSDKISAMMGAEDLSRDFHGNLTMTRQLRSIAPANYRSKPTPKSNLEPSVVKDNRLQQLSIEVQFWKRHFNMAESRISDLIKEKNSTKSMPLKMNLDQSIKDTESLYLKKLLDENLDLKLKLDKLSAKSLKDAKIDDVVDLNDNDSGKENDPEQTVKQAEPNIAKKEGTVTIKSKSQNILRPKPKTNQTRLRPQSSGGFAKADITDRGRQSSSFEGRGRGRSAETMQKKSSNNSSQQQQAPVEPHRECDVCDHQLTYAENYPSYHPQYYQQYPHHNHHHSYPEQQQIHVLRKRIEDLTEQNRCLTQQLCQLKADFLTQRSYNCSCKKGPKSKECSIQCLQKQICHLKHELQHHHHQKSTTVSTDLKFQLDESKNEIGKLEAKCDNLLEQKKTHLEKISNLQKQLDTLLSSPNVDSRVKSLINNIESQRDAYKHQVENLISDLQRKDQVIIIEREKPSDSNDGRIKKTILSNDKVRRTIVSQPSRIADDKQDDLSTSLELLQVRSRLAETSSQLDTARREIVTLRETLEEYKSQLQNYNVKQTQTSPIIDRRREREEIEEAVNDLKNRIIDLERENIKLKQEKLKLERQNSLDSDVVDIGINNNDQESKELRMKVQFLENQLSKTEDNLRNCQNLMSENSKRSLDLNSQIVRLRQDEMSAKKSVDDLQLKLDKKDDLIRRVIEDKDKLLSELQDCRDKLTQSKSQVNQKSELLNSLDKSKDTMEGRIQELEVTVKQLERDACDRERRMTEIKQLNRGLEEENRNVKLDNGGIRVELEHLKSETERLTDESQGKSVEIVDIRAELQRYITEVKRVEELLDIKENDRINLLEQYEVLSKEISAYEATNRSLEMQAANLMLEVRSREDDLVAAKQRCDGLEKYVDEILAQNEQFRLQVSNLTSKVDVLTSDLKSNRVTRDGVITDLESVNQLAVRLNSEKIDLVNRISNQNKQVEDLQSELVKLREELLGAMGQLEDERHRARTLQRMVTSSTTREERETVIRSVEEKRDLSNSDNNSTDQS